MSAVKKILLIESSGDHPFVALTENENVLKEWYAEKNSGFAIHDAIQHLLKVCSMRMQDLDAVSVTEGPGSYTGLRVGMATAKGICYAMKKPLITVSTLKVMAMSLRNNASEIRADLICPMIDARRDEVFMAIYDSNMDEVLKPAPFILGSESWKEQWNSKKVLFSGSGSKKIKETNNSFHFTDLAKNQLVRGMAEISLDAIHKNMTASVMWAEPAYLKPFFLNK